MKIFRLLLFTALWVFVSSATLRGVDDSTPENSTSTYPEINSQRHRHLMPGTSCTLYTTDIEYSNGPTEHFSKEVWMCKLSPEESARLGGIKFVDIDDAANVVGNATSGKSELIFSTAFVDLEEGKMYLPKDTNVTVRDIQKVVVANRASVPHDGTFTTLMIRIIDSQGRKPKISLPKLEKAVFTDDVCVASQMHACSYGKVKIQPFKGETNTNFVDNGVVDLHVDYDVAGPYEHRSVLQGKAFEAAAIQIGDLDDPKFDLVMFCMPAGEGTNINWLAYAIPDEKYSFFSDPWCMSVSAQMHEIGHNFNLGHSGEVFGNKYSDQTGMMGYSYLQSDGPKMCYNPAKSYQLGWYKDQVKTINPLESITDQYTLNGVADYTKNPDALVVLHLSQPSSETETGYYIGYNRKIGVNEGAVEDVDMITIVRKDNGVMEFGPSTKVAALGLGQSFVIEDFNGDREIKIEFIGRKGEDATITVANVDSFSEQTDMPRDACTPYTVEVVTDNFPGDNTWYITEDDKIGTFVGESSPFQQKQMKYTTELCLKYSTHYDFHISDRYGDGICCQQGKGSYSVRDPNNNVVVSSADEKFRQKTVKFRVHDEQKSCANHTVKVVYDKFHTDNTWKMIEEKNGGRVIRESPVFKAGHAPAVWIEDICLEFQTDYTFVFEDSFGDGICCKRGNGSYEVTDSRGQVIVASKPGRFKRREESFKVSSQLQLCKDKKQEFKITKKWGYRSCEWYAKKNKCIQKKGKMKEVWQMCPAACGKCLLL